MNSKIHRCGWCGHPTDKRGEPLSGDSFKKALRIIEQYGGDNHTHLEHGWCCEDLYREEPRMRVTRDMAIDAGDPSLEGQWV